MRSPVAARWMTAFVTVTTFLCASAQNKARPERAKEIVAVAELALVAPPELGADILLKLSESPKIKERAWKIDLLETAFQLAPRAKFPFRLVGGVGRAGNTDSDAGVLSRALAAQIDTLSLQCRVIKAMLALDRARALEMFEGIPIPQFAPLSCKNAMKPAVAEYYTLVLQVFERGYSEEELRKGRQLRMLEDQVQRMNSPFQLEAITRLLREVKLDQRDFAQVMTLYAGALKTMTADDRSFTSATHHGLTQEFYALLADCPRRDVSILPLVDAYRTYLLRHLTAARCADSADPKGEGATIDNMVHLFNRSLLKWAPETPDLRPISDDERKPTKADGRAEVYVFWEQPKAKSLLMGLKRLRFGTEAQQAENANKPRRPDGMANFLDLDARRELPWEMECRQFLNELEGWQREHGESPANYFHQLCAIYAPLVELAPPGALRDSVISSYITFLRMSPMERESPPEWLMEVKRLTHFYGATTEELTRIREMVRNSGSPAMVMYIE